MKEYFSNLELKSGFNDAAVPGSMFNYISGFSVLSLGKGKEVRLKDDDNEIGLNIFSGSCDILTGGKSYRNLGARPDVFQGLPTGVYIPKGTEVIIKGSGVEMGVCRSKCEKETTFAVISPSEVKVAQVGKGNWAREVHTVIGMDSPSVNLILGETLNPPGNWSGTPSHKHEKDNLPQESLHEELYYFKTERPGGFGIERLYSPERKINELLLLKNNTVTFMPWGYHQIVAGPGYLLYYLFFLSGAGKELKGFVDPDHAWLIK